MARGWESKSVEQQQAEQSDRNQTVRAPLSPEEQKRNRQREGLLLSRERLHQQLKSATNPSRRRMLEQAISDLDRQILSLTSSSTPANSTKPASQSPK